ncbi:hypothetical protein VPLG_00036 [Vibrio phage eugene 12A10]|uniref:hypothetical protein n=1 Tax=Vibrio phage eugene 12A10 TaxID=573172 RepID=UPI00035195FB|nr:hypothetical protein VPLG_00036 [Vibrio phage eugene 12A10]AGN51475.1 hypothetical protein VPLG_00036 [Vibrio phage eugene 12A10]
MSDQELIKALQEAPDYGIDELFEATGRDLDELTKIPTVDQVLQTGTGSELDTLAENLKFKSVREEDETDRSFRARLWTEYYNGVWDVSLLEDNQ